MSEGWFKFFFFITFALIIVGIIVGFALDIYVITGENIPGWVKLLWLLRN